MKLGRPCCVDSRSLRVDVVCWKTLFYDFVFWYFDGRLFVLLFWCTSSLATARNSTTVRRLRVYPRRRRRAISTINMVNETLSVHCFLRWGWLEFRQLRLMKIPRTKLCRLPILVQPVLMTNNTRGSNRRSWSAKTGPALQVNGGLGATVIPSEGRKSILEFEDLWLAFRVEESCPT